MKFHIPDLVGCFISQLLRLVIRDVSWAQPLSTSPPTPQHPWCHRSVATAHTVSLAPTETSEVHGVLRQAEMVIPLAVGIRGQKSPRSMGGVVARHGNFAGSPAFKRRFLVFKGPKFICSAQKGMGMRTAFNVG